MVTISDWMNKRDSLKTYWLCDSVGWWWHKI